MAAATASSRRFVLACQAPGVALVVVRDGAARGADGEMVGVFLVKPLDLAADPVEEVA